MKRLFVLAAWSLMAVMAGAQTATTFEMRYFTPDAAADGVTDFHGETEWFTTPQRVEMLGKYARYASRFWGNPGLDTPLFAESAVAFPVPVPPVGLPFHCLSDYCLGMRNRTVLKWVWLFAWPLLVLHLGIKVK